MHRIRLRGPWQERALWRYNKSFDDSPAKIELDVAPCRVQAPCDWGERLGDEFRGCVKYSRQFNCPTGLTASHRVLLVVQPPDFRGMVSLNDHMLGELQLGGEAERFEVSDLLAERNLLSINVELPLWDRETDQLHRSSRAAKAGGLIGEVWLEIDDSAA